MKLVLGFVGLLLPFTHACSALPRHVLQPVKVEGYAMRPTLNDGDRIFIARPVDKLDRGDIVIFYYPPEPSKSYIKRIIGLPGEEFEVSEGKVVINGKALEESYLDPATNQSSRTLRKVKIPDDNFYVLGDNRDNSNDSRIWGPLPRNFIYGKFVGKYATAK